MECTNITLRVATLAADVEVNGLKSVKKSVEKQVGNKLMEHRQNGAITARKTANNSTTEIVM